MKVSELWLREWINPTLSREALCERLTMAGLEIESITPVAEKFSGVVVGKILSIEKHPDVSRLSVCNVDIGDQTIKVVSGAKNIRNAMKIPVAVVGAILPCKAAITASAIHGITSYGMLCSAHELGLAEKSDGVLEFSTHVTLGEPVWDYLHLTDHVLDVSVTPNRGDCLSVSGLAQEISALTECELHPVKLSPVKKSLSDTIPVNLKVVSECPHYVGRIIRGVTADAITPMWLQERLRRAGVRCISAVVDVMNYVMLELGQPMHAFDLAKIDQAITVRHAKAHETLLLLDGQTKTLAENTLIIADQHKPLAIAGVMGGLDSAVTLLTQDIFLESAYFSPEAIARSARQYLLGSESSYRFERSVDASLQVAAIERATQLLLEITSGKAGPVIDVTDKKHLPTARTIALRKNRVSQLLGITLDDKKIETIFQRLGLTCKKNSAGWSVHVPLRRADLVLEVDLIEEIMRLYGSDHIPTHHFVAPLTTHTLPENQLSMNTLRRSLNELGYHEVITYSFVDDQFQMLLNPNIPAKLLLNPISADMNVMRTHLWPGLIKTFLFNQNRQQSRVRIFETGLCFLPGNVQENHLGGLISGNVFPEQWGIANREVDFFDLKGDVQTLCGLTHAEDEFTFKQGSHPALHPGQTAEIFRGKQSIGILGALHPKILQTLDIAQKIMVFEFVVDPLLAVRVPQAKEISKFPEIRRDIACLIKKEVPVAEIEQAVVAEAKELLQNIVIFDVYQGKNIQEGHKSIAIGLTLQHSSRTLVDEEVAELIERVIVMLKGNFGAELRG